MRRFLSVVIMGAALLAAGCGKSDSGKYSSMGKPVKGDPDDPVYSFEGDDADMNAAVAKARDTIGTFISALENRKPSQTYFGVKKPYRTSDKDYEHIWIDHVSYDGAQFHGTIGNLPANVPELKMGQKVAVLRGEISDWMIVENRRLLGGYTIRVMRDKMSPQERTEFDKEIGLTID